jgi:acyl-CoA thioesterase-1
LIQAQARADGIAVGIINAGISGDTTAGGRRRVDGFLGLPIDVLVIALGANDGLRGMPLEETERNLRVLVEKARARHPDVRIVLAGMRLPPNLGPDYTTAFESLYPRLAGELNLHLWPFMLEGVAGSPGLNLDDGIHPNAAGQRLLAESAWRILKPLLEPPPQPEGEKP